MTKFVPVLAILLSLSVNVAAMAAVDDVKDQGIEIANTGLQISCSKDKGEEGGEGGDHGGHRAEFRYVANHHEDKAADHEAAKDEHAHADHHESHNHDAHHTYDHDDAGHHDAHKADDHQESHADHH